MSEADHPEKSPLTKSFLVIGDSPVYAWPQFIEAFSSKEEADQYISKHGVAFYKLQLSVVLDGPKVKVDISSPIPTTSRAQLVAR